MLENRTPSAAGAARSRAASSSSRQPLTSSSHQANTLISSADPTVTSKIASTGEAAKYSRKLDEKLTRTQARLEEVEAEKHQLSRKNEDLATELRLAAQREAKLKAGLDKEKARGGVGGQGGLLAKLEELQRMHQESKEKWKASLAEVRKELEEEKKSCEKAQRKAGVALEEVKGLRTAENEQADKTKELEKKLAEERTKVEGIQFALARAKDELATRQEDEGMVDELEQNLDVALKSALKLADQRHDGRLAQEELQWTLSMALAERDTAVHSCKVAQAETADLKVSNNELSEKAISLAKQLAEAQSFSEQLHDELLLTRADVSTQAPPVDSASLCSCILDSSSESAAPAEILQLTFLKEDVQLLTGRLCQAQADLNSLYESHLGLLQSSKEDSDALSRLRPQLASSQSQLQTLIEEKMQLEVMQARLATALEEEKVRSAKEEGRRRTVEAEKRNMEENARTAVREAAMMREKVRGEEEEKAELLESLASTAHYQQMYSTLLSTSHTLLHRLQASEADLHSLSEENMLLASHSNPTQKILYLDGLRRRLAESRDEVGILRDEEGKLKERVKALEGEVRAMKGLEGGKGGRVRRVVSAGVSGKRERRRSSALTPAIACSSHPASLQVHKTTGVVQPKGRARPSRVSLLPFASSSTENAEVHDGWSSDEEEEQDESSSRRCGEDEEFTMHELTYGSPRK